jgi:hypothetical protein
VGTKFSLSCFDSVGFWRVVIQVLSCFERNLSSWKLFGRSGSCSVGRGILTASSASWSDSASPGGSGSSRWPRPRIVERLRVLSADRLWRLRRLGLRLAERLRLRLTERLRFRKRLRILSMPAESPRPRVGETLREPLRLLLRLWRLPRRSKSRSSALPLSWG